MFGILWIQKIIHCFQEDVTFLCWGCSRMSRCLLQEFPGVGRDTHRTTQRTPGAKVRGTQELREPGGSSQDGRVSWLWYHGFIRVFVGSPDFWGVNPVRDRKRASKFKDCVLSKFWSLTLNLVSQKPIPLMKYHPILSPHMNRTNTKPEFQKDV